MQMPESTRRPVDSNALPLLRRMITHGCFWRSNGWPEAGAWQLDLYALPHFNKPAWTADWKPQHFLALLDDYERLLKEEQARGFAPSS